MMATAQKDSLMPWVVAIDARLPWLDRRATHWEKDCGPLRGSLVSLQIQQKYPPPS